MDPNLLKVMQNLQETKRICDDILKPRHPVRNVIIGLVVAAAVICIVLFVWLS